MRHFLYFNGSVRAACAARTHLLQHWSWLLPSLPTSLFQRFSREGHTRSHSEHGSQASLRRWYLASGPGRVGRRWILEAPRLTAGGLFVFRRGRSALTQELRYGTASLSPPRLVSTSRLRLTAPCRKRRAGLFLCPRQTARDPQLPVANVYCVLYNAFELAPAFVRPFQST